MHCVKKFFVTIEYDDTTNDDIIWNEDAVAGQIKDAWWWSYLGNPEVTVEEIDE